jgi:mitochondrial translocator assembly and maintenance protein 41
MISTLRTRRVIISRLAIRSLSTEQVPSSSLTPHLPPHLPPPHGQTTRPPTRSRINPAPRPAVPHARQALPSLPSTFGRNQILPVADSTRALLESIVSEFHAPIRYAFAYGSGVFEQDGYSADPGSKNGPMLDFMFAVTHASHWHSINMNQFPGHYPLYGRMLGSDFVARVQGVGPGVWFNTFVPMKGVVSLLSRAMGRILTTYDLDLLLTYPRQSSMASQRWTISALTCLTGTPSI